MCGLWGFAGAGQADQATLQAVARLAGRRGPDGTGIWADGRLRRGNGRDMTWPSSARVIIGHARLATVLATKVDAHGQPIQYGPIVVAHNGSVWNYPAVRADYPISTGCDSEVIAIAIARAEGSLAERFAAARAVLDFGAHYALAVYATWGVLLLAAHGQNLFHHETGEGVYWSSVRPDERWHETTDYRADIPQRSEAAAA